MQNVLRMIHCVDGASRYPAVCAAHVLHPFSIPLQEVLHRDHLVIPHTCHNPSHERSITIQIYNVLNERCQARSHPCQVRSYDTFIITSHAIRSPSFVIRFVGSLVLPSEQTVGRLMIILNQTVSSGDFLYFASCCRRDTVIFMNPEAFSAAERFLLTAEMAIGRMNEDLRISVARSGRDHATSIFGIGALPNKCLVILSWS